MIKLGMADETFKHYHGVFNDSTQTRVRRYPKEIWDTYPQAFAVPGGRDVFACRDLKLQALRGSFAAFQAAVTCDNAFILTLSERACFSMERDSTRYTAGMVWRRTGSNHADNPIYKRRR